ncbi:NT-type C2 domain [Dillenia turbinata]|uniref:NT-type C2 domain n=1 Tax=Dillenia turbinata TaxID=194707 RepID=A0AAN8VGL7_9MAGN
MMLGKNDSGKNGGGGGGGGDSSNGRLLRDIEEISKALYLHKAPPKALVSQSSVRSKSAGKSRVQDSKSRKLKPKYANEELLLQEKKPSIWKWKPLKALSHIGYHRFHCCFFLHVHLVEGLPSYFNDIDLCIHWKRKDESLRTRSSHVLHGVAEFDETLMRKCVVYGSKSGPHHAAKYEAKHSLVYVAVLGAPAVDLGKHWIDLTRLLPLTLEELDGEKSMGKWTTSFKLIGKAKGATLNVSFGFSVIRDHSIELHGNITVPDFLDLGPGVPSSVESMAGFNRNNGKGKLQQDLSIHGSELPSQLVDVKFLHDVFPSTGLELSSSIKLLYKKLDEVEFGHSEDFDFASPKLKPSLYPEFPKGTVGDEDNEAEFIITEKGIELPFNEEIKLDENTAGSFKDLQVDIIDVSEIIEGDEAALDEHTKHNLLDATIVEDKDKVKESGSKDGEKTIYMEELVVEDFESELSRLYISKSQWLDPSEVILKSPKQENCLEANLVNKAGQIRRSLSLDDVTEAVATDFLKMLDIENGSTGMGFDGDPESPRECLLRQFEKEALAAGDFIFDFEARGEQMDMTSVSCTYGDFSEEFEFAPVNSTASNNQNRLNLSLRDKRKARMLENLETGNLMRQWGLNEASFQSSPRESSGGFGSPIAVLPEKPVELPALAEGLGSIVRLKIGGFLRSMNPILFKNFKSGGRLVMQASNHVVLPAEMGSNVMEILQHLASFGVEKLSMQVNNLMPLEEITGKTWQQVVLEPTPLMEPKRKDLLHHEPEFFPRSFDEGNCIQGMGENYVCSEDLILLAMEKIEALLIEGLRMQAGMSNEEAPSRISPLSIMKISISEGREAEFGTSGLKMVAGLSEWDARENEIDFDEIMGLSLTLDEWIYLDAGIVGDEEQICQQTLKILMAHHANFDDLADRRLDKAYNRRSGLLGNNFTLALMVQLRDPLRDFESVGAPILALVDVERNKEDDTEKSEPAEKEFSNEEGLKECEVKDDACSPLFKIIQVHVAGLNTKPGTKRLWGTTAHKHPGSRWLLANGLGKTIRQLFSTSKAIVKVQQRTTMKEHPWDTLWSISSSEGSSGSKVTGCSAMVSHTRNPDIIFPSDTMGLQ